MDLTYDDILKILKIIDESDYGEVRLEIGDLKLHVRKQTEASQEAQTISTGPSAESSAETAVASESEGDGRPRDEPEAQTIATEEPPETAAEEDSDEDTEASEAIVERDESADRLVEIKAPMLGTFYRAPSPGEDPFVEVGDQVGPEDTVCLIEVMKLFNSISAGISGRVSEFLAEDGELVEYQQPLVRIEPGEAQ